MEEPKNTALVKKRNNLEVALPAPPPSKRIKRPATVLDEDTYLNGLSHIIARDYFPGLVETEAKQELLDALDSKDDTWISSAQSRLHNVLAHNASHLRPTTLQQTPRNYVGDTPLAVSKTEAEKPDVSVNLKLSLGAYQAKYTSEDNESFNALLDKQNSKNRNQHAYLWNGNNIPSARLITYRDHVAKHIEQKTSTDLILAPEDTRPSMPIFKPTEPRNTLMFAPDSVEDILPTLAQDAERKSNAPPKSISAKNTRFEELRTQNQPVPQSPSLSAINEAVAGKDRYAPSIAPSVAPSETPRVAGYAFVDAEPTEEELRAVEATRVTDTATILAGLTKGASKDAAGSPFSMKEAGKREQLHHRLVDKAKAKGRIAELTGGGLGKTPTPKFKSAPAKGSLTPAAEKLLGTVNTPRTRGNGSGMRNFDLTPAGKKGGSKKDLHPGLTPKR
jgi:protein DGCR14